MTLTAVQINGTRPNGKTQKLFDGLGLYLEVSPSGGKWWRLKYRFAGKEKRLSLGVYPEVSLKESPSRQARRRQPTAIFQNNPRSRINCPCDSRDCNRAFRALP